jgi:hypothetical protein
LREGLADGVEEGYAAFYSEDETDEIGVYALRWASSETKPWIPPRRTNDTRFEYGQVVAFVSGRNSKCFEAISQHLGALGKE